LFDHVIASGPEIVPDGKVAVALEQRYNDDLRAAFYQDILNRTVDMIESYWQAQVFSGRASPPKNR
jgi:hypothetical protein